MSEVAAAMPVPLPDARRGTSARQSASVGRAAIVMPVLAILAKLIATLFPSLFPSIHTIDEICKTVGISRPTLHKFVAAAGDK